MMQMVQYAPLPTAPPAEDVVTDIDSSAEDGCEEAARWVWGPDFSTDFL